MTRHAAPQTTQPTRRPWPSRGARGTSGRPPRRPSLVLWRHRHLVVAACAAGATVLGLTVLAPPPQDATEVLVAARALDAGELLTPGDVERREVASSSVPGGGLAGEEVIGQRAAIHLEEGTVLTASMASGALATGLRPGERLVQVSVGAGADLAAPGALVDVIAPGGATAPDGGPGEPVVLCPGARVVTVTTEGSADQWSTGRKVTLVTLAVPQATASLVVGAATASAVGLALTP